MHLSSVLIGIIGIALFMGIAIGSAIFLGPRFEDAQAQSLGSSAISAVSTVAGGVNSYRMATGYAYGAGLENTQKLVTEGFLRAVPSNMVVAGRDPQIVGSNGLDYASTPVGQQPSWNPKFVYMSLGTDQGVCGQIMRMLGYLGSGDTYDANTSYAPSVGGDQRPAGCFRTNTASAQIAAGDYVAYARIGGA